MVPRDDIRAAVDKWLSAPEEGQQATGVTESSMGHENNAAEEAQQQQKMMSLFE